MANILSQEEVDALLQSFSEEEEGGGEKQAEASAPTEKKKEQPSVTVYDFRRPNRISKDQLSFLETLHETFLFRFTGVLSGYFRTLVEMSILSVEQLTYGEWIQSLPETTCLFPFTMEPMAGSGVMEVNPSLVLSMVDRLLGGQGAAVDHPRDLTHLEVTLMRRIVSQGLEVLGQVWSEVTPFTPKVESFEKHPGMLRLLPDTETVVLITFEVKTQTINGAMTICYPFVSLESAMTNVAGAYSPRAIKRRRIPEGKAWVTDGIESGEVEVSAKLGTGTVTIGEFIRLKPGDVIRLDAKLDDPVVVEVLGEPKFLGRPGLSGKKLAVQLIGYAREEEQSDAGGTGTEASDEQG